MGLEFITQPQVFTQRLTALGGIEGYVPPFVSSFFTWTSTSPVTATTFPLPGSIGLLDIPGSYIVSVGGVLQSPTNYVINVPNRTLTFDFTVNANTDVVITQIGTVGLSSNIAFLSSQQFIATNLSATTGSFNSLLVSNLTALSSVLQVTDIQLFELSGFNIQGNLNVSNNLSALNYIITDNGSFIGATSATTMNIGFLSARGIDLIHSPANDGVDPILNIGETDTAGFSGFRVRYEEPTNRLIGSSRTGTTILTSFMIDTATGQVGISGLPASGQALTVWGDVAAIQSLNGPTEIRVQNTNTGASASASMRVVQGTVNTSLLSFGNAIAYIGTNSNHPLAVVANNNEAIRIDTTGNIGIGTFVPNQRLTVVGNVSATGNLQTSQLQLRDSTLTTNTAMGTAVLGSAAGVVINTNRVTLNSRIFLTTLVPLPNFAGIGTLFVGARTATTSFTVSSTNINDRSIFSWMIVEPTA